jgi:hypothetical protein
MAKLYMQTSALYGKVGVGFIVKADHYGVGTDLSADTARQLAENMLDTGEEKKWRVTKTWLEGTEEKGRLTLVHEEVK